MVISITHSVKLVPRNQPFSLFHNRLTEFEPILYIVIYGEIPRRNMLACRKAERTAQHILYIKNDNPDGRRQPLTWIFHSTPC